MEQTPKSKSHMLNGIARLAFRYGQLLHLKRFGTFGQLGCTPSLGLPILEDLN